MADMTFKANLNPNTDNYYSLGTTTARWKVNGYGDPNENVKTENSNINLWKKILLLSGSSSETNQAVVTTIAKTYATRGIEVNPYLAALRVGELTVSSSSSHGIIDLYNNDYKIGYLGPSQSGTTSQIGYIALVLGNSITEGTDGNTRGQFVIYGKERVRHIIYSNLTDDNGYYLYNSTTYNYRSIILLNYPGSLYLIHAGSSTAVGSVNSPVYVDNDGRVKPTEDLIIPGLTIDLGTTKYDKGNYGTAITIKFRNKNNYLHTIKAILIVGNDASNANNGTLVVGSNTGDTIIGSGESLDTFATAASILNGENLYLTSDNTISFYSGLSNSATNYESQRMGIFHSTGFNVGNENITNKEIGNRVYGPAGVMGMFVGSSTTESGVYLWGRQNSYSTSAGYTLVYLSPTHVASHYGRLVDNDNSTHAVILTKTGSTYYTTLKHLESGNISLNANNNGVLNLGFESTTALNFMNGRAIMDASGTFLLLNTIDAGGGATPTCAFVIGSKTGAHIEMDNNEILAKSSATTATTLYILDTNGSTVMCGTGGVRVSDGRFCVGARTNWNNNSAGLWVSTSGLIHIGCTATGMSIASHFQSGSATTAYIEESESGTIRVLNYFAVNLASKYAVLNGQSDTATFRFIVNGESYLKGLEYNHGIRVMNSTTSTNYTYLGYNHNVWMSYLRHFAGGSTTVGYAQLALGNGRASGTADNARGLILLYTTSTTCVLLRGDYGALGGTTKNYIYTQCLSGNLIWGAVYNDYAEFRETENEIEPGRCVIEQGNGSLKLSTTRLMRGGEIVSDTYGFAIGETKKAKTPIAASGRVLAYCYEGQEYAKNYIGWPVGTGPNGTVSIMTEEEERLYPSRIIGTISEIPNYKTWQKGSKEDPEYVDVNNRIWIRIR